MSNYPKRLIEVDLPIARISAHARREKSIRHGHISTLHIWWARRPLAACRAVICAALWPDPADELCPPVFRQAAIAALQEFARRVFPERVNQEGHDLQQSLSHESWGRWEALSAGTLTLDAEHPADMHVLRMALLDFIADFANWDNSTVPAYLDTSRSLTQAAHEALGGEPGTRPLVVDPFAGGGSIPLEALRVGADAFASDLNPIPVLLNKVVLEYIPKYGNARINMHDADGNELKFDGLAAAVRYWGKWVQVQAEKELAEFYPKEPDGSTPIAYLWARTILSEAPGQGDGPVEVPMMRSFWLCKKPNRKVALRWVRDESGNVQTECLDVVYADGVTRTVRRPKMEVFEPTKDVEVEEGTAARGSVTCPVTGYTTPVSSVRTQLIGRRGGATDARLLVIVDTLSTGGRRYRRPTKRFEERICEMGIALRRKYTDADSRSNSILRDKLPKQGTLGFRIQGYGMSEWRDVYSARQLHALSTLVCHVAKLPSLFSAGAEADAIGACLGLAIGRLADRCNSLCTWDPSPAASGILHLFGRQAVPMIWDFAEGPPLESTSGGWLPSLEWIAHAIDRESRAQMSANDATHVARLQAQKHVLPDDSADALITDPPYYDAVPYADLSGFFRAWLRLAVPSSEWDVEQSAECIVDPVNNKDRRFFEDTMSLAMAEARRYLRPNGIGIVVFAHKGTAGWEAQLQSMISAGWTITGSWPVDTEMATRLRAMGSAALASSVHLVCRPRVDEDGVTELVGEWRDVLDELPKRIHEWMPRLAAEGVVGADAIFACLGPALEVFSRFNRVEKASGEAATLREYLEHVWAVVATEALSMIFRDADAAGLEPDARLAAMWLWTLGGGTANTTGSDSKSADGVEDSEENNETPKKAVKSSGFILEFDAARKIAQGLGADLEKCDSIVEILGDKARLLPVAERTAYLFGKQSATSAPTGRKANKARQQTFFDDLPESAAGNEGWGELKGPPPGTTVLDRLHQSMILFAANRGELLKRFLVDDGVGQDARFWKLAQSLSALYPPGTDERRWVEGVLSRKKGLGL